MERKQTWRKAAGRFLGLRQDLTLQSDDFDATSSVTTALFHAVNRAKRQSDARSPCAPYAIEAIAITQTAATFGENFAERVPLPQ